jgi:hypothetical protein
LLCPDGFEKFIRWSFGGLRLACAISNSWDNQSFVAGASIAGGPAQFAPKFALDNAAAENLVPAPRALE